MERDHCLGSGGYGVVVKARHLNGDVAAAKIVNLERVNVKLVQREIEAMSRMSHPNIVHFITSRMDLAEKQCVIIMELASQGTLFSHVMERGTLSESQSRVFFAQIVSAVEHIHKQESCIGTSNWKTFLCTTTSIARYAILDLHTFMNRLKMPGCCTRFADRIRTSLRKC